MSPTFEIPKNPVARMATGNYVVFVTSVFLAFLVSPILIRGLGDARYGTWNLILQVTGYYGLLDLGVRTAVGYYVARCLGSGEYSIIRRYTATAFLAMVIVGALIVVMGVVLGGLFPKIFRTEEVAPDVIRRVVMLVSLSLGMSLALDIFAAVLNGARRAYLVAPAEMISRILTAFATILAITKGQGLTTLALIQLCGRVLVWFYSGVIVRRTVPYVALNPRSARVRELRNLAAYGSRNLALNLALLVIYRVDLVVVGAYLGVKLVAVYSIGQMFITYASSAVSILTRSFTTQFTHLHAAGDEEGLRQSYLQGVRLSALIGLLIVAFLLAFGTYFIRLWLEPVYATGPLSSRSDVILSLLALGEASRFVQSISWQLLIGTGRQHPLVRFLFLEAALNIAISLALVRPLGLPGVALGTVIPVWLTNLILLPPKVRSEIGLSFNEYWNNGLRRPIVVFLVTSAVSAIAIWMIPPETWISFIAEAGLFALVGGTLAWRIALTPAERNTFLGFLARMNQTVFRFRKNGANE